MTGDEMLWLEKMIGGVYRDVCPAMHGNPAMSAIIEKFEKEEVFYKSPFEKLMEDTAKHLDGFMTDIKATSPLVEYENIFKEIPGVPLPKSYAP